MTLATANSVSGLPLRAVRLSQSPQLDEVGPGRLPALIVAAISITVVAFVACAAVMPVAEVTPASGEVLPTGSVKHIQHLEGGIIARILVSEGDIVEKDQLLIELSGNRVLPELKRLRTRLAGLELQAGQLRAAIDGRTVPVPPEGEQRYAELAASQISLLDAKRRALASQETVLRQQIAEREAEVSMFDGQIKAVTHQLDLVGQQVSARAELAAKGYAPRMQLLDNQREYSRLQGQLTDMVAQARRSRESAVEAESRLIDLQVRFRTDAVAELDKVTVEMAELRQAVERDEDRVKRLEIRAPVHGIVHGLQTETVGGVVAPGSTVLDIIPVDARLQVEARIPARDIGHVQVGLPVSVKVMTYDYTRYGSIPGVIETLSPTSFLDDHGNPYYRARIHLERDYVGVTPGLNPLSSGMTVIADIRTGERTLMEYMMKPVYHSLSEALRER
ncbi:MAG: HlyD family type I secretion periplasmic adaptor subunit [Azospirillum sp.]|nr:HlyD family type I secretion periplasmic adaptor subunit [Azospirillum sp.]